MFIHTASLRGIGGCTFDSCFLSLLISSKVCRSRTGISPSESLSRKSKTDVSDELLHPLALAGTADATVPVFAVVVIVAAAAAAGTVAATGMLSSSVLENRRLLGGRQVVFSRVNFGGLPADEPDCGVDVEAALSVATYNINEITFRVGVDKSPVYDRVLSMRLNRKRNHRSHALNGSQC